MAGNYRRGRRYSGNYGLERALQHIREAELLSKELGGTDKDVKRYFFSLSGWELKRILDDYEQKYGLTKRQYAERTIPMWKSGARKMSGLVAGRLFNLLPPRMPMDAKYNLIKALWEEYSPRSNEKIWIGPEASEQEVINTIQSYLIGTIINYKIPSPLERRFHWLSSGDVHVQQKLLNHFLDMEKSLIIKGIRSRVPVLLAHIQKEEAITQKISQHIKIGKHKVEICFHPKVKGIKFGEYNIFNPTNIFADANLDWLWKILVWAVILVLIAVFSD